MLGMNGGIDSQLGHVRYIDSSIGKMATMQLGLRGLTVVVGDAEGFRRQWELVLFQVLLLLDDGLTLKESLLRYQYPVGSETKDVTNWLSKIDYENGVMVFEDNVVRQLTWCVHSARESARYWFDSRFVLCPDKRVLMFD